MDHYFWPELHQNLTPSTVCDISWDVREKSPLERGNKLSKGTVTFEIMRYNHSSPKETNTLHSKTRGLAQWDPHIAHNSTEVVKGSASVWLFDDITGHPQGNYSNMIEYRNHKEPFLAFIYWFHGDLRKVRKPSLTKGCGNGYGYGCYTAGQWIHYCRRGLFYYVL